jgi:hypothetical protein
LSNWKFLSYFASQETIRQGETSGHKSGGLVLVPASGPSAHPKNSRDLTVFIYNGILFNHKDERYLSFAGKWMELEIIILGEVSQVQKVKVFMFSLVYGTQAQYNCKQYHIYKYICTIHVPTRGSRRGD